MSKEQIIEVFRRINSTNYSLNDMEINNAMYGGKFKSFCEDLAELDFFERHSFFRPMQSRRMGDVKFVSTIIITMIGGYFNRDDLHEEYLRRYNDEFPEEKPLRDRFTRALSLIEELNFSEKSRAWKQTDFFTLVCELDDFTSVKNNRLDVKATKANLERFYQAVDSETNAPEDVADYLKATIQAANDRGNRVLRGKAIRKRLLAAGLIRRRV